MNKLYIKILDDIQEFRSKSATLANKIATRNLGLIGCRGEGHLLKHFFGFYDSKGIAPTPALKSSLVSGLWSSVFPGLMEDSYLLDLLTKVSLLHTKLAYEVAAFSGYPDLWAIAFLPPLVTMTQGEIATYKCCIYLN